VINTSIFKFTELLLEEISPLSRPSNGFEDVCIVLLPQSMNDCRGLLLSTLLWSLNATTTIIHGRREYLLV
jgi:hypothetical protein